MTMRWIYSHPFLYELLDLLDSFGLTRKARGESLRGVHGKVLEVGIGSGLSVKWLRGAALFGVDISMPMLRVAKARGAKVCLADAHRLPLKDGAFDFVVFLFSLRLMQNQREALGEALRVGRKVVVLEFVPLYKPLDWFGFKVYGGGRLDERIFDGLEFSKEQVGRLFVVYKVNSQSRNQHFRKGGD